MRIRPVDEGEFLALGALTVDAYQRLADEPLGPYAAELEDVERRASDSEVLVAVDDDGTLLGGVTYVADSGREMSEFSDAEAAGIRMLAVDPAHQGRGAGRLLVEACVARAREDGRRRVLLHSTPRMVTAQALYRDMGFERVEDLDVFVTEPPFSEAAPLHLVAFALVL